MSMAAVGDLLSNEEKLVILLGSLNDQYDTVIKIIENTTNIDLLDAKEMLRREHEKLTKNESDEIALQASRQQNQKDGIQCRRNGKGRNNGRFKGVCFYCDKAGHKASECRKKKSAKQNSNDEHVFAASVGQTSSAWLLDSGASSHMSSHRNEFIEYRTLDTPINISIANGSKLSAVGIGSVRITLPNKERVRIEEVLFVPQLDRRLLSVPSLVAKGLDVTFEANYCEIKLKGRIITKIPKIGKMYQLVGQDAEEFANKSTEGQNQQTSIK
jgi:hypothetical protein